MNYVELVVSLCVMGSMSANAQVVIGPSRVHAPNTELLRYDEPTIAVSAADSRKIAIGWIRRDGPQILLGAITLSGIDVNDTVLSGFTPVPQLPFVASNPSPCENLNLPTFAQADPISATSRVTGEVWIGGQAVDNRRGGL